MKTYFEDVDFFKARMRPISSAISLGLRWRVCPYVFLLKTIFQKTCFSFFFFQKLTTQHNKSFQILRDFTKKTYWIVLIINYERRDKSLVQQKHEFFFSYLQFFKKRFYDLFPCDRDYTSKVKLFTDESSFLITKLELQKCVGTSILIYSL